MPAALVTSVKVGRAGAAVSSDEAAPTRAASTDSLFALVINVAISVRGKRECNTMRTPC
jgi:hypothetical protein